MPITLPVTGQPISTAAFGIPVARALNNLVPTEARATADLTLAAGAGVLAPGATLAFTPTVAEIVLAWAQADVDHTVVGAGIAQVALFVNGVARPGAANYAPGVISRAMQTFMGITACGAGVLQTFELRGSKSGAGGTCIFRATHTRLILIRVAA